MINNISSTANGGALYLYGLTRVEMYEVQCSSNTAKLNGGAVAILGEPQISMGGCSFTNNSAGAAVRTRSGAFVCMYCGGILSISISQIISLCMKGCCTLQNRLNCTQYAASHGRVNSII